MAEENIQDLDLDLDYADLMVEDGEEELGFNNIPPEMRELGPGERRLRERAVYNYMQGQGIDMSQQRPREIIPELRDVAAQMQILKPRQTQDVNPPAVQEMPSTNGVKENIVSSLKDSLSQTLSSPENMLEEQAFQNMPGMANMAELYQPPVQPESPSGPRSSQDAIDFARGFGHGAFGLGDQVEAYLQTRTERRPEGYTSIAEKNLDPFSGDPNVYRNQREENERARQWKQQEIAKGNLSEEFGPHFEKSLKSVEEAVTKSLGTNPGMLGNVLGTVGSLYTPMKAFMPLAGLGASESGSLKGMMADTAMGGAIGAGLGKMGKVIGSATNKLKSSYTGAMRNPTVNKLITSGGGAYLAGSMVGAPGFGDEMLGAFLGARSGKSLQKNLAKKASSFSQPLLKKATEKKAWNLKFISPLESPVLKMFMLKAYPSFNPDMGMLLDVKDRQSHTNALLNNPSLSSEERAMRIETTLKDGKIRYDDLHDDWYEQRGYKISPVKKEIRRADSMIEAANRREDLS